MGTGEGRRVSGHTTGKESVPCPNLSSIATSQEQRPNRLLNSKTFVFGAIVELVVGEPVVPLGCLSCVALLDIITLRRSDAHTIGLCS